jgi:hypothetical protein
MRSLTGISVALMFAGALLGQNGQNHFGAPVVTGGFPNAVFPAGTPATNPNIRRFIPNAVFPGGGGPHLTIPGQRVPRYTGSGAIVVPYAYPVYVNGGGYDDTYSQQPMQQQPNVTVIYPPQPAPVIVNQFGQRPEPRDMAAGGNPEPVSVYQPADQADQPASTDHYLIALKDHTIYAAVAYWVNGDTLHYFTSGNVHNQASLSLVDRDLTARLNKESGVEVKLPADK